MKSTALPPLNQSKENTLYDNSVYQRRLLNECKRVAEICYILLMAAGEEGEKLEYIDLLDKTHEELSFFPEDEKIQLSPSEIQLMCVRCHENFYNEIQELIEKMKLESEYL